MITIQIQKKSLESNPTSQVLKDIDLTLKLYGLLKQIDDLPDFEIISVSCDSDSLPVQPLNLTDSLSH